MCCEKRAVSANGGLLLPNLLQSSRRTCSRGRFLSFFACKESMVGPPMSVLEGWATGSPSFARPRSSRPLPTFDLGSRLLEPAFLECGPTGGADRQARVKQARLFGPYHLVSFCQQGVLFG